MGAIWLSPGGGPNGDGDRPDRGHANAVATVRTALEAGIRDFDTAPWYGSGASEERLGRALLALASEYDLRTVRVTSKVGRLVRREDGRPAGAGFDAPAEPPLSTRRFVNDYTATGADMSLAESLSRLQLPRLHGLRVHDPNDNSVNRRGASADFVDEVAVALSADGALRRLASLRHAGEIDEVGIGMNANAEAHQGVPDEVVRMVHGAPAGALDSALLAGGWNLLTQAGMPCLAACEARAVRVHVAGVFASGLLVGGETYAYVAAPAEKRALAREWARLAAEHGLSLPAVAIAFAAAPVCVERLVIGMASAEEVRQNLLWVDEAARVPATLWADARQRGLLQPDVPLPT